MSGSRPGRRTAVLTPRGPGRSAVAAAATMVLAIAAVLLAGTGAAPGGNADRTVGVLVDHAVDGCPSATAQRRTRTSVVAGSAPAEGLGSGGTLRYGEPGAGLASAAGRDVARGELLRLERAATAGGPVAVEATGELAAGLFTFRAEAGRDGTVAVTECSSPRARWWFTGAGATLDHTSELVLSNLDPGPAVVDVRVLGPDGEVETLGTRGITVPPGSSTGLVLTDVAPQGEELAVSVVASRGRVVAAVSDRFAPDFGAAEGLEWLPAQASASRVVRLAGLPRRADAHTLVVANPSGREALVELTISGGSGSFAPVDAATLRVPPGAVASVDLAGTLGRGVSAVTLRSPVPVTATVRSVTAGDTSYAGSVQPLTGAAVAPLLRDAPATVQLTAGQTPATATVTAYRANGTEATSATVEVAPGATVAWRPEVRAGYLVVTPGEGRVFGAVGFAGPAGSSQVSLAPLTMRVDRPVVRPAVR